MESPAVLIFGRDKVLHQKLNSRLVRHGFSVNYVRETSDIIKTYDRIQPDLTIVYSTGKSRDDQLKIVENIRKKDKHVPIILSTRYSSEARAIAALRAGVSDYFKVPISTQEMLLSAKRLIIGSAEDDHTDHESTEAGGIGALGAVIIGLGTSGTFDGLGKYFKTEVLTGVEMVKCD